MVHDRIKPIAETASTLAYRLAGARSGHHCAACSRQ
jgi:hypothetical protein